MKTALNFLHYLFQQLILKPFDYLLFGGSGVLWRSRDEWKTMVRDAPLAFTNVRTPDDGPDTEPMLTEFMNIDLPGVYDGPEGEAFFMEDNRW